MDHDFAGYMDNLAAVQAEEAEEQAMLEAHEVWKQTTWGGWAVGIIQSFQEHFRPFLSSTLDLVNDEESLAQVLLFNAIRMLCLFILIGVIYMLANVFQRFIGTEYIVEEEVVIVHEHKSEAEAKQVLDSGKGTVVPPQKDEASASTEGIRKRGKKSKSS
uniref:Uncharacterized protein n=1 Tax=Craspedostauros australis TaxID=1486917 RepID=A0A7S0F733_9STRA|mmetsp:Transcript_8760/g.23652  ORF Transcript_8760/g.23652 Transcript_8760/m.23652 type:complete len:160 (+) Transcript_8760:206-685(+)